MIELQFEDVINIGMTKPKKNIQYVKIIQDGVLALKENIYLKVNPNIVCDDGICIKENWCDSYQDGSNIVYYINNNIIVNNLCYNIKNISSYQFTVDDLFNFFVETNVQQLYENVNLKQDVVIRKKDVIVITDIDGQLIANNIYLSQGEHTVSYKIINTTIQKSFKIKVNNYFVQDGKTISFYNVNDLYKAKMIKNHKISTDVTTKFFE